MGKIVALVRCEDGREAEVESGGWARGGSARWEREVGAEDGSGGDARP